MHRAPRQVEAFIESLGLRPLANHGVGNLDFALSITELPV
jgi:hypothetical protein